MERFTEYHAGVPVLKDKAKMKESMARFAELEERDTAKRPVKKDNSGIRYTDAYRCPNCGKGFTGTGIANFCYHCGQRLDWRQRNDRE